MIFIDGLESAALFWQFRDSSVKRHFPVWEVYNGCYSAFQSTMRPTLTYILPDLPGGVASYVRNLLRFSTSHSFETFAILTQSRFGDSPANQSLGADHEIYFPHRLPKENLYAVARRLLRLIPDGPGVVVTNDVVELAAFSIYDPQKMIVMIMHGDYEYYYDLATKHANIIDYFVASSRHMSSKLSVLMPERSHSIRNLPCGVALPSLNRNPPEEVLRVIYVGGLSGTKRVLDLPKIDQELQQFGVEVHWTIAGSGPEEESLRNAWAWNPSVCWTGHIPTETVVSLLMDSDVFVLPSQSEGFPVSLVEAAAAGVVPVVSDLPSGIPEVVHPGSTGFRVPVGDVKSFAQAIASLAANRSLLEQMSKNVRDLATSNFDIRENVKAYDQLFESYSEPRVNRRLKQTLHYGSRLDRPWIPNFAVRAVRAFTRRDL